MSAIQEDDFLAASAAQLQAASPRLILQLGCDVPRLAQQLLAAPDAPAYYLIIAPDHASLAATQATDDCRALVADPRVVWLADTPDTLTHTLHTWLGIWPHLAYARSAALYATPQTMRNAPERFAAAEHAWHTAVTDALNDYVASPDDALAGIRNTLDNLDRLAPLATVRDAHGCAVRCPGIVIGAGPSLHDALPMLRAAQHHALLAAAPSALPVLLANGIAPHFWIHLERLPQHAEIFRSVPPTNAEHYFVVTPHIHPDCWAAQRGTPVWLECRAGIGDWLSPDVPLPQLGQSSTHAAFHTLAQLGCPDIYLVGQDLAYRGGVSHTVGTWAASATAVAHEDTFEVPGNDRNTVRTNALWHAFLRSFVTALIPQYSGRTWHVIDAAHGARIDGAVRIDPTALVAQIGTATAPPLAHLRAVWQPRAERATTRLARWRQQQQAATHMLEDTVHAARQAVQHAADRLADTRYRHADAETWRTLRANAAPTHTRWHAIAQTHWDAYRLIVHPLLQGMHVERCTEIYAHWTTSVTEPVARTEFLQRTHALLAESAQWLTRCHKLFRYSPHVSATTSTA